MSLWFLIHPLIVTSQFCFHCIRATIVCSGDHGRVAELYFSLNDCGFLYSRSHIPWINLVHNAPYFSFFCLFRYQVNPIWTASVCLIVSDSDQKDLISKEHSIIRTPFRFLKILQEISMIPLCNWAGKDSIPLGQVLNICTRPSSMCAYGVILIRIKLWITYEQHILYHT